MRLKYDDKNWKAQSSSAFTNERYKHKETEGIFTLPKFKKTKAKWVKNDNFEGYSVLAATPIESNFIV